MSFIEAMHDDVLDCYSDAEPVLPVVIAFGVGTMFDSFFTISTEKKSICSCEFY